MFIAKVQITKKSRRYNKRIYEENKAVKKIKGIIKYTNDITFSSSNILNSNIDVFNQVQKNNF